MRLTCPICGERDRREFYYVGDAVALQRPGPEADFETWDAYVHLRDNPAGVTHDLWQHECCGAWIVVTRNTVTHDVVSTQLAKDAARRPLGSTLEADS